MTKLEIQKEIDCITKLKNENLLREEIAFRKRIDALPPFPIFREAHNILPQPRIFRNTTETLKLFESLMGIQDNWTFKEPIFHVYTRIELIGYGKEKLIDIKGNISIRKIIINDPAVIIITDESKYVSIAHNEKFDIEKGFAFSMLKMFNNGEKFNITNSQLHKLMNELTSFGEVK